MILRLIQFIIVGILWGTARFMGGMVRWLITGDLSQMRAAFPARIVTGPPWSRVWQIPAFVLGMISLGMVVAWGSGLAQSTASRADAILAQAQKELLSGQLESVSRILNENKALLEAIPEYRGHVHYLKGSALLIEGERMQSGTEGDSRAIFADALAELQEAENFGVSDNLHGPLNYRKAKAEYFTGAERLTALERMERGLEESPADRLEGYRLLARLYLDQNPPRVEPALRAVEKQLTSSGLVDPVPVRLLQGKLLMQLGRLELAAEVLDRIPQNAPEFIEARHLYAMTLYEKENWQPAVKLWEGMLTGLKLEPATQAQIMYRMGMAYHRLGRVRDAEESWRALTEKLPGSPEAVAGGFQLADLLREQGQDEEALSRFIAVLKPIQPPYENSILSLSEARQIVGRTLASWFESGEYDRIRRLSGPYRQIAVDGEAERCYAVASQAAGLAGLRKAEQTTGSDAAALRDQAHQLFRDAGAGFEAVARYWQGQDVYSQILWAGAENYLRAEKYEKAAQLLTEFLGLETQGRNRLDALVGLGEAFHGLNQHDQAIQALTDALKEPGPLNYRARYLLALAYIAKDQNGQAEAALQNILSSAPPEPAPPEYRKAMFSLGYLLYSDNRHGEAAAQLEKALEQYPTGKEIFLARYRLAEAYRLSALDGGAVGERESSAATKVFRRQREGKLERALTHFRKAVFGLTDLSTRQPLTEQDDRLLKAGRFRIGDCLLSLRRYEEALAIYDEIAKLNPDRIEHLIALAQSVEAHRLMGNLPGAVDTIVNSEAILSRLPEAEFQPPQQSRQKWQDWLNRSKSILQQNEGLADGVPVTTESVPTKEDISGSVPSGPPPPPNLNSNGPTTPARR